MMLLFLFGPLIVRGRGKVPKHGPLLILANHASYVDPIALSVACRRHIVFIGNADILEEGLLTKFVLWWGLIPIVPNTPDRAALRRATEYLKAGHAVCIFPEGGLSDNGEIKPFLPGATLLYRLASPTVICCGLRRMTRIIPVDTRKPRPSWRPVYAAWGEALKEDAFESPDAMLQWAEEQVHALCAPGPQR